MSKNQILIFTNEKRERNISDPTLSSKTNYDRQLNCRKHTDDITSCPIIKVKTHKF